MATVPVFAPDGTLGDIPEVNLPAAVKAGGKMGVVMTAPDGTEGVIPADRVQEAVQAGGKLHPLQQDQPAAKPGFLSALGSDLKGMISGGYQGNASSGPDMSGRVGAATKLNDQQNAELTAETANRKAAGYSRTYRALAPVAEGLGANVSGMEQSAQQGNLPGVLGHATAVPLTAAATEGVARGLPFLKDMLPSKARAGANFQRVMGVAKDVPIDTTAPGNTALDVKDFASRGGRQPKVITDFIRRATDPEKGPITYEEGRDFASNAGELSYEEKNALKPNVRRMVRKFSKDMNKANAGAAAQVGVEPDFLSAMKEYSRAKTIDDFKNFLGGRAVDTVKYGVPTAIGGTAAGYAVKKILKQK